MIKSAQEAIVLRTKKTGEYNKLVFLFTREKGKIKSVAYGARKIKNRFGSALEQFTYGRAMLIENKKGALVTLDQMEINISAFELFSDYVVSAHLYYYSELLDYFLPEEQQEERIFRLTLEMLKGFRMKLAPNRVAAYFELWLIRLLGLLPDYRKCYHCKCQLKEKKEIYISKEGYLFCADCRLKGLDEGKKIQDGIYNAVRAILKNRIDSNVLKIQDKTSTAILDWTTLLFQISVGKEIKSYNNLKEIRDF